MTGAGHERRAEAATGGVSPDLPSLPAAYTMSMTVELWFGDSHIGVREDSPRCHEFLRYANQLLEEYREARPSRG